MVYLVISVRKFQLPREDEGYYIFVDRMKEGSGNVIGRNVQECKEKSDIDNTIKTFISNYKKEYHYLRLWNNQRR